jgi:hypothetical protein
MSSDINQILYPKILTSLRTTSTSDFEDYAPPVQCIVWKGGEEYETITFDKVYPFDTIEDIKRMICAHYERDHHFIPKFTFLGVPLYDAAYSDENPTLETEYLAADYLWYPTDTNNPAQTYILKNPRKLLKEVDDRFVTESGEYTSPKYDFRDKSTIETVFLKPREGQMPVFHVYTLYHLLREFETANVTPIAEKDWNGRFAPYFINVPINGPYTASKDDIEFARKVQSFIKKRAITTEIVNNLLEEGVVLPQIKVSGIRQLRLMWRKPIKGFEGCGYLFYNIKATEKRPFIRLIPIDGSAITKLHVKGILPIPTLDDPRVLEVWGKEVSPTPKNDFCYFKYVHTPGSGIKHPIYGTVQIYGDGTINLLLQPPKEVRKLDPITDFRYFETTLNDIFTNLPQDINSMELKEIALIQTIKIDIRSPKFTKARLLKRLPLFQTFFQEITPLPGETTLLSIRYKAVDQYASEDKKFRFLTQYVTQTTLEGDELDYRMVTALQNEFQLSKEEAKTTVNKWFEMSGKFTVVLPEEGEFIESVNPGIDIHIYAQHPSYYFHINRIDSYASLLRINTLLGLLFIEEDEYFTVESAVNEQIGNNSQSILQEELEQLKQAEVDALEGLENINQNALGEEVAVAAVEEAVAPVAEGVTAVTAVTAASASMQRANNQNNAASADEIPEWMLDTFGEEGDAPNVGEVVPEEAPNPITELTAPAAEQSAIKKKGPKIGVLPAAAVEAVEEEVAEEVVEEVEEAEENAPKGKISALGKDEDDQKLVNPSSWFIEKLQQIDSRLFKFKTARQGKDGYSRKCAGNEDRQPSVLTKEQYERMMDVYEEDNILFIVYPLDGSQEPPQPHKYEETYTLMKFGSDADNINYYFCPEYYCLSDEIMIRPKDFKAKVDREGRAKPPNTCPFCKGKLITNSKIAVKGHTVIKRALKKNSDKAHVFIRFLAKSSHPDNLALPCCFVTQRALRISDPDFSHIRSQLQQKALGDIGEGEEEEEEDIEEEELESLLSRTDESVNYAVLIENVFKRIILESNKVPNPGNFATAPPLFDQFFAQDSANIVTRVSANLKLRPNAQGFIRIGTQSSVYESLLGVLAPILSRFSINEVRERIIEVVTPRVFILSHFGNLVLEFYNPADESAMPPTIQDLKMWASKELQVDVNSTNELALVRVYNSFKRFIRFMKDPTQRKDLRHVQPLLAEPGLFTSRGTQLLLIEKKGDNLEIKCPTFGISLDRHRKCDFVFISREMKYLEASNMTYAYYELYLYTNNIPAKGAEGDFHESTVAFNYSTRRFWPSIVQARVDEFMNQCQSRYRSVYTSQQGVNSMAMVPLSKAIESVPFFPVGIVRDSYNHICGITFRSKPGKNTLVALPVIDDGFMATQLATHFDWNDFTPAQMDDVVEYYRKTLQPLFALYPGYNIKYAVRTKFENKIVALQLENGIYIPCGLPKAEDSVTKLGLDIVTIEELEWEINKEFTKPCGKDPELLEEKSYDRLEELYQQFRLIVSNWLTSTSAGPKVRKDIEKIIFSRDLPEYERRKRLYIYLSPILLSWFYADEEKWEMQSSFLRKDCRVINSPDSCTGSCYWKEDEGKCLLHVDAITKVNERDVSTPELFTKKIIDELVRFPARRKQLMAKGEISKVSSIIEPIRQGDQYIIPETSTSWTNLLRLEWARQTPEKPKYFEEMTRKDIPGTNAEESLKGELPEALAELLGEDSPFRLNVPDIAEDKRDKPLLPFTAILGMSLAELGVENTATILTKQSLQNYVKKKFKPIGMIDLTINGGAGSEAPSVQFYRPMKGKYTQVTILVFLPDKSGVLIEEEGSSLITIAKLPENMQEYWRNAGLVMTLKNPVIGEVPEPIIIGTNPIRNTIKRKPKIGDVTLIEAKPQEGVKPVAVKRKPKMGKLPAAVNGVEEEGASASVAATATATATEAATAPLRAGPNILRSQTRKKPRVGTLPAPIAQVNEESFANY